MTPAQRQATFNRFFTGLARAAAERRGLGFAGTLRKLPPPPLPGDTPGDTRYYLNAIPRDGSPPRLIELKGEADRSLRRAEAWLESGRGPPPPDSGLGSRAGKLKHKV